MDVLNFISWIKNGQQVTTVDPTQTLLPLGLRDPRRDDGYRSGTITAQDFINSVAPPSIISVGTGQDSTVRTGLNNTAVGSNSTVLGCNNSVYNGTAYTTISGGGENDHYGTFGVIAGGYGNTAFGTGATVSGGDNNYANAQYATISGGSSHQIFGNYSTISGGVYNCVNSPFSNINGGAFNTVRSSFSQVVGGCRNFIDNFGCYNSVLGGQCNVLSTSSCEVNIIGSCITSNRSCATFVNNLSIVNIPTSAAGLPSKSVWSNAGVLTIVP